MTEITVGKNDAGQRLDRFLRKTFSDLPVPLIQKAIRKKQIKLNGKKAAADVRLAEGDIVTVYLSDAMPKSKTDKQSFSDIADAGLCIIYEDRNIILLDKPPGLLCHSNDQDESNTLIAHVRTYLYQKGEYDPDMENAFAPALCNRIDRDTGGIVIAAKNAASLRIINEKIRKREIDKFYLCIISGLLEPPKGKLECYILRNMKTMRVEVLERPFPGAKHAVTEYRTLAFDGRYGLVECRLITGRTHQIRAQMHHAGHPIVGDPKYTDSAKNDLGFKHQALYSYKIKFDFRSDAGELNYLNRKTFKVDVPFSLPGPVNRIKD